MVQTCLLALISLAVALYVQARLADRAARRGAQPPALGRRLPARR
jgi:hypothetical protein